MASILAEQLIEFYKTLEPPKLLPKGVAVLFPQQNKSVIEVIEIFFKKYYSDNHPRRIIFGINPGRFGAGVTGINFTAPKQLKELCGIDHPFKEHSELSAEFIYEVLEKYGGVKKFYRDYFITAISPLGYVKDGVNLNYYDDKKLLVAAKPFIVSSIQKQLSFGFKTDYCICIGGAGNFDFFTALNNEYHFFKTIIPLPHPRFILQYRRKQKESYVHQYLSVLCVAE
ncbi:MAG: DUF4918 family protein [Bacteroidetes bacterium]|nr:DUF4918 family protein [Bacteroidota bacterium]MBS1932297.1 DUF4918 family protein [Bacteroidota bacterium]